MNRQEIKYILGSAGFAIVWFMYSMPYLLKTDLVNSSPYTQFILFNLGLFLFFQIFLKMAVLGTSESIKTALGLTLLFITLDVFAPPFLVSQSGELLNGVTLAQSSSDFVLGFFGKSIGLSGFLLDYSYVYLFTYIIAPILILIIAAYLLRNLVEHL